jgi:transcriptional regulator with XRE-family HTH domain
MTASLVVECSRPIGTARAIAARRSGPGSGRLGRDARQSRVGVTAALTNLPTQAGTQATQDFSVSPPGVIGGAVIRAARKSARISRRKLARILAANLGTVRSWENGTCPLFSVTYDDLSRLAAAFDQAGPEVRCDVGELMLAAQCDLLIVGMLRGFEDYAEVPPVDEDSVEGEAARDLLRWALVGLPPDRYRTLTPTRPLLARHDVNAFTALALRLSTGSHGDQLTSFGSALTVIKQVN